MKVMQIISQNDIVQIINSDERDPEYQQGCEIDLDYQLG
jgi:hypothetical protein